jgi:nucleotide-binding universal stress UspA family protein
MSADETDCMHRFRHLMVGLSRTDADAALIRYAAMVARLGTAAEVRFVHVLPSPTDSAAAHSHDPALADIEAAVREHFTAVPETVHVYHEVLKGPLMDRLLAYTAEQEVDVLLLGHRRDHPLRYALARRLAMKAPCSVWLCPEGSPGTLKRILVPIDFSEHAADALQVATSMAKLVGQSECQALHVYFNEARATYEEYDQVLRGQEWQAFEQFITPLNLHGVVVRPLFEEGASAARIINRVAAREGCDLVVMATRGRSRSAAILLGSVTEETIVETSVPLLVVKHYGARLGVLQALLDRGFRSGRGPQFQ